MSCMGLNLISRNNQRANVAWPSVFDNLQPPRGTALVHIVLRGGQLSPFPLLPAPQATGHPPPFLRYIKERERERGGGGGKVIDR
jgi:hypothetical protein